MPKMTREEMLKEAEARIGKEKMEELRRIVDNAVKKSQACTQDEQDAVSAVVAVFSAATRVCNSVNGQEALVSAVEMLAILGRQDANHTHKELAALKEASKETSNAALEYQARFVDGNNTIN